MVEYLPISKKLTKMSRNYICNVVYSLTGSVFENWVKARVDSRNDSMAIKKDLMVSLDPGIANCFLKSQSLSSKLIILINELFFLLYFHSCLLFSWERLWFLSFENGLKEASNKIRNRRTKGCRA